MYSKMAMKQRILLSGKDGIDLLQRITTLDFKRLEEGIPHPGLFLNAQGKILCYFEAVKKPLHDQIEVTFENQFLELLDQYTFSERYQIEKLDSNTSENTITESERIKKRSPKEGNEFFCNGESNPLEINLQSAIHDQKGCYPGQEVIEKIIAIGSPSKRLCMVRLIGDAPQKINLPMDLDFGKLTSFEYPFGLAVIRKTHAAPGSVVSGNGFNFEVVNEE